MTRFLHRLLALATAALALAANAGSTHSIDFTDLWYLPAEDGWGVNVVQQNDIVFATFFVYGPDGTPRWYVAPEVRSAGAGTNRFTGVLYSTTGTWFGAPWSGRSFGAVGNVTFTFNTATTGSVTYTVNTTPPVTKQIVRQSWGGNVLTGNYIGGLTAQGTQCGNGVNNGPIIIHGEMTVVHNNATITPSNPVFTVIFSAPNQGVGTCTFAGQYRQEGKIGRVNNGTFSCQISGVSNPPVGTFTLSQIEASNTGMNARFVGADQNCNYEGFFGGIKDVL